MADRLSLNEMYNTIPSDEERIYAEVWLIVMKHFNAGVHPSIIQDALTHASNLTEQLIEKLFDEGQRNDQSPEGA